MNARGYLELLIEENPTDEHSAALRELDQLLADAAKLCLPHKNPDPVKGCPACEWYERAVQAGYGEK